MLFLIGISNSIWANPAIESRALVSKIQNSTNESLYNTLGNCALPINFPAILSAVNVTCPYTVNNGSITISNLPPFNYPYYTIDLYLTDGSLPFPGLLIYHVDNISSSSYTFPIGLGPGNYYVIATDPNCDTHQDAYSVLEDSKWPIHPLSERAEGVDVKTDNNGNLYATGWYSGFITFNSTFTTPVNTLNEGYLVSFDPCGNVIWDQNFLTYGDCKPTALCMDVSNNIIVTGSFSGTVIFPGGVTLIQVSDAQVFIAKFDRFTGKCLWASSIRSNSSKGLTIKDVTADKKDKIFVLGNFYDGGLTFCNASNIPSSPPLNPLSGGPSDNYMGVFDKNGDVLYYMNAPLSTLGNDKAGGICCAENPTPPLTDIYITGQWNNTDFLGQHYLWDYTTATMTLTTNYQVTNQYSFPQEGNSVATYDPPTGNRSISFAGTQTDWFGTFPFFTHKDLNIPYPPSQLLPHIDLVTSSPFHNNFSTDIAINQYSGEMYVGGGINENGVFPLNGCLSYSSINTLNDAHDFFYLSFIHDPICFLDVRFSGILFSHTPGYIPPPTTGGCDEMIGGICADNNISTPNTSFMTGSFSGNNMVVRSAAFWLPNTVITPNLPIGLDCFISRVYFEPFGYLHMKNNEVLSPPNNSESNTEKVIFYPNPAIQTISFLTKDGLETNVRIQLLDITGNYLGSLYEGLLNSSPLTISIDGISKGAYIIQFESPVAKYCKKLIVL